MTTKQNKITNSSKWFSINLIALLLILVFNSCGQSEEDKKRMEIVNITMYSEEYITNQLKSPSTAEFGDATITKLYDEKFHVVNTVDSQNSFGGIVRSTYELDIILDNTKGTYTIENVNIK